MEKRRRKRKRRKEERKKERKEEEKEGGKRILKGFFNRVRSDGDGWIEHEREKEWEMKKKRKKRQKERELRNSVMLGDNGGDDYYEKGKKKEGEERDQLIR
jgi:hypothetical protein